jgi:hypothetical protein
MNTKESMEAATNSIRPSLHRKVFFSRKYTQLLVSLLSLLLLIACTTKKSTTSLITIHLQTATPIELLGYDGLTSYTLFEGNISSGSDYEIDTPYYGLGMLTLPQGQTYPVILGGTSFSIKFNAPSDPPSFSNSQENEFLYSHLLGKESQPEKSEKNIQFARLMIQAKQLLKSSQSIHSTKELTAKKNEFHEFVREHYDSLRYSDMVRRLIAQYFMMHEYVNYHVEGAPAADIRGHYQQAVLNGVGSWLEILKSHIPEHEILNYCVSLYYKRSMVSLASLIVGNFQGFAYCPGIEKKTFSFPDGLLLTGADGNRTLQLGELKGKKLIAFVSNDCPVSMVETIIKARQLAGQKKDVLIVAPLQKLSPKYLLINRMVSKGNMVFVNDEKWRKDNLAEKIQLPLFIQLTDDSN